MFNNIGSKIKSLAEIVCRIGIAISVLIGVILLFQADSYGILGLLVGAVGALLSWIGAFVLYGFGQLVENSDILVENSRKNGKQ